MPDPRALDDLRTETVVPLVEETFDVTKREVVEGDVTVRVRTDTTQEVARATLERGSVEVTRVPVGRTVERAPDVRVEGDTTIFPVMEELLTVQKRLVLKEEIHIRRRTETETVEQPVTLRRQHATVERTDAAGSPTGDEREARS